jgi:hypothetical protein
MISFAIENLNVTNTTNSTNEILNPKSKENPKTQNQTKRRKLKNKWLF